MDVLSPDDLSSQTNETYKKQLAYDDWSMKETSMSEKQIDNPDAFDLAKVSSLNDKDLAIWLKSEGFSASHIFQGLYMHTLIYLQ